MASRMSQRWLKKLGATVLVALAVTSVVCAVYAQNAAPTDEPTTDIVTPEPATVTPTETREPATAKPTEVPPQPTAVPTTEVPPPPTALPTTEAQQQPTMPPATVAVPVQIVTDLPTTETPQQPTEVFTTTDAPATEATVVENSAIVIDATTEVPPTTTFASSATAENPTNGDATTAPTLTLTATDAPPVRLTLVPTGSDLPTATPELPTETATADAPTPEPASISLSADATQVTVGDIVTLTLSGDLPAPVEIVSALCEVDPARLSGQDAAAGDRVVHATLTDSSFLSSGQWVLRAQSAPDAAISGSGTLWRLSYRVSVAGQALMACRVQLIDSAGQPLPLTANAVAQAIDVAPAVAVSTDTPAATEITPTEVEVPVEAPTDIPQATMEATDVLNADAPVLTLEAPTDLPQATPELTLEPIVPEATPEATDVLDASAPELTLAPVLGDVDGNGLVNQDDADLVLRYFGQRALSDEPSVDLNGDGLVNIYDLTIVAGNMHKNGDSGGGLLGLEDTPEAQ